MLDPRPIVLITGVLCALAACIGAGYGGRINMALGAAADPGIPVAWAAIGPILVTVVLFAAVDRNR